MLFQLVGVRSLYHASFGLLRPYPKRKVIDEMRDDFNTWMMFFEEIFDRVISYRLVNLSYDFGLVIYGKWWQC